MIIAYADAVFGYLPARLVPFSAERIAAAEIATRIASLLTTRHTGDEEADLKKLESTQYLKLGMDKDAIKLAIAQLQSHLRISPKRVREAPHALFRWILKKVPTEIKDKCDLITERINIAEAAGETVEPIFNGTVLTLQNLSNELVEYIKKASCWVECCFLTKVVLFFNIRIHVHSYACVCIHMHFVVFCMHSDALHSTNRLHSNAFCNHFELLHSSDARRLHSDAFSYLLHSRHVTF
jgi:hypothetical protein